jgi:hypothetical protein
MRFRPLAGWVDQRSLHGTVTGYRYGCRCADCGAANTAEARAGRARRAAALGTSSPQLVHGKKSTYVNHRCRCQECVDAQRVENGRRDRKRPLYP